MQLLSAPQSGPTSIFRQVHAIVSTSDLREFFTKSHICRLKISRKLSSCSLSISTFFWYRKKPVLRIRTTFDRIRILNLKKKLISISFFLTFLFSIWFVKIQIVLFYSRVAGAAHPAPATDKFRLIFTSTNTRPRPSPLPPLPLFLLLVVLQLLLLLLVFLLLLLVVVLFLLVVVVLLLVLYYWSDLVIWWLYLKKCKFFIKISIQLNRFIFCYMNFYGRIRIRNTGRKTLVLVDENLTDRNICKNFFIFTFDIKRKIGQSTASLVVSIVFSLSLWRIFNLCCEMKGLNGGWGVFYEAVKNIKMWWGAEGRLDFRGGHFGN